MALPDGPDMPAMCAQQSARASVSLPVPVDLRRPESPVGMGELRPPAVSVSMPEATVDEKNRRSRGNDEIRLTGERIGVPAVPNTQIGKNGCYLVLRSGMLVSHARHYLAAFRPGVHICHAGLPMSSGGISVLPAWTSSWQRLQRVARFSGVFSPPSACSAT